MMPLLFLRLSLLIVDGVWSGSHLKCNIFLLRRRRKKASGAQECGSAYIVEAYAYLVTQEGCKII